MVTFHHVSWNLVSDPLETGAILASKYRVERVLGAGGMGVVVAASHMQLGSRVALKFMLPGAFKVRGAVERFLREARAVARLRGEHVARVTDFGTLETGAPYIVMEFLEGSDLDAVLEARGPLPVREALGYVLDACEAMDEAHQQGIVHRDLKPKNLFLTHRPNGTALIKVLDFGISKVSDLAGDLDTSTQTGSLLGSPAFMAPEQLRNAKYVDARADIYALGGIMYYLMTKTYPYDAQTVAEFVGSVLYKEARPLRALLPDAPPALEAIVARCLHKDPNARFSTARELGIAIRTVFEPTPVLAALPASNTRVAAPESAVLTKDTLDQASISSPSAPARKAKSLPLVLAGGLTIVAMVAGGFLLLHTPQRDAKSPRLGDDAPLASAPARVGASVAGPSEASALPPSPPASSPQAQEPDAAAPPGDSATRGAPTSRGEGHRRPSAAPVASTLHYGGLYDEPRTPPSKKH